MADHLPQRYLFLSLEPQSIQYVKKLLVIERLLNIFDAPQPVVMQKSWYEVWIIIQLREPELQAWILKIPAAELNLLRAENQQRCLELFIEQQFGQTILLFFAGYQDLLVGDLLETGPQ